jgi:hypothetical protein
MAGDADLCSVFPQTGGERRIDAKRRYRGQVAVDLARE